MVVCSYFTQAPDMATGTIVNLKTTSNENFRNERTQNIFSVRLRQLKFFLQDLINRLFRTTRDIPITFLFLGQTNVGISAAMKIICKDLFGHDAASSLTDQNENGKSFVTWTSKTDTSTINFVEIPAFGSAGNFEHNAKLITALNEYLKTESRAVPNFVFIIASLKDSRFEGDHSSFSNMLNCLKYQGNRLTASSFNNFVLILTQADSLDILDSLETRKKAYNDQFKRILGVSPRLVLMIGQDIKTIDSDANVNIVSSVNNTSVNQTTEHDAVQTIDEDSNPTTVGSWFGYNYETIGHYINKEVTFVKGSEKDMESLCSDVPNNLIAEMTSYNFVGADIFPEIENTTFVLDHPSFSTTQHNSKKYYPEMISWTSEHACNVVNITSKVVLADGTLIDIKHCSVGDRLLGHKGVGVITNRIKLKIENNSRQKHYSPIQGAEIYVVSNQHNKCLYQFYDTKDKRFRLSVDKPSTSGSYFGWNDYFEYIEVDDGKGTFIVDGYLRKCTDLRIEPQN